MRNMETKGKKSLEPDLKKPSQGYRIVPGAKAPLDSDGANSGEVAVIDFQLKHSSSNR